MNIRKILIEKKWDVDHDSIILLQISKLALFLNGVFYIVI